jgi:hypothetical protein
MNSAPRVRRVTSDGDHDRGAVGTAAGGDNGQVICSYTPSGHRGPRSERCSAKWTDCRRAARSHQAFPIGAREHREAGGRSQEQVDGGMTQLKPSQIVLA